MKNKKITLSLLIFFFTLPFFSQNLNQLYEIEIEPENLPEIISINPKDKDINFQNFTGDSKIAPHKFINDESDTSVAVNKVRKSRNMPQILGFYKYTVTEKITLLQLSARFNIRQDTIATLNNIQSADEKIEGLTLIIPTVNGIFVSLSPKNPLQIIVHEANYSILQNQKVCYNINSEQFVFLEDEKFSPADRAFFTVPSLDLPIDRENFYISSSFGGRKNPFSGEWKAHNGIDFAANEGVPVKAVKSGKISLAKTNDEVFGNYIIIDHEIDKMTSVYAHLSKMNVSEGQRVKKGDIIGYVGQTGMATGPHLHFEIRYNGTATDPAGVLPLKTKKQK